jgi:asparagine synthase (glutamine-hydrolysing)
MGGIFGLVFKEPVEIPPGVADAASKSLSARGPDGLGIWYIPGEMIGVRRLAIIEPHRLCPLPTNESGRYLAAADGEIYNHSEIRGRLEREGHLFRSNGDLEVLPHLAETRRLDWELGLRGMFAFSVWDKHERRLHLARDRFGIKPLFWCGDDFGVAFASTLQALKAMLLAWGCDSPADQVSRTGWRSLLDSDGWQINPLALRWYFETLSIPAPLTLYYQIQALPPGSRLIWEAGEAPRIEPYWRPQYLPKRLISKRQAQEELNICFRESLKRHLKSDVPVAAILTSEVDSALLVVEAAAQIGHKLSTCSFGVHEEKDSDLPLMRDLARACGTHHQEILLDPIQPEDVTAMVRGLSQPLGDCSAWKAWAISRAIGKDLKVVLSADGGDEVWGGDPMYARYNLGRLFRTPDEVYRQSRLVDPGGKFWGDLSSTELPHLPQPFPCAMNRGLSGHEQMLEADVRFHLPSNLLARNDSLSMSHSLEMRFPWLDPVLFELVAHFPPSLKINGGVTQWLVRKEIACRKDIPDLASLLAGRKQESTLPVDRWMAKELAPIFRDTALACDSSLSALLDQRALRRSFEAHRAGWKRFGNQMWAVLVLEIWLRESRVPL